MKGLLVLGCAVLAAMSCKAAPALNRSIECAEAGVPSAAHLTLHHINDHHKHGYKFQLRKIVSSKVDKVDEKCGISLELSLEETKCHVVDPRHFEECQFRYEAQTPVVADCNATLTIKGGEAFVTTYHCETKRAIAYKDLIKKCPDCNLLLDLDDEEGRKSVEAAVRQFNQNITNQRYYVLQDAGRMSSGYIMGMGMMYYAEYALIETRCPMGSRIVPEACKPLCPTRARHAFCHSSYSRSSAEVTQKCDFYEAENTTSLAEGEKEPSCPRSGQAGFGPHGHGEPGRPQPPNDHREGPPTQILTQERVHAHGPPVIGQGPGQPHHGGHSPRPSPFWPSIICHSVSTDKAVHPICDWPSPRS